MRLPKSRQLLSLFYYLLAGCLFAVFYIGLFITSQFKAAPWYYRIAFVIYAIFVGGALFYGIYYFARARLRNLTSRGFWFGLSICFLAGIILTLVIPIQSPTFSQEHVVHIVATGKKNQQSKGSEIWLYSISTENQVYDAKQQEICKGDWELKGNALVSHQNQPSILVCDLSATDYVKIKFGKHKWSGIVELILDQQDAKEKDLFSTDENEEIVTFFVGSLTNKRQVVVNLIFTLACGFWIGALFYAIAIFLTTLKIRVSERARDFNKRFLDFVILLLFFIYALIYSLGVWNDRAPKGLMPGDAANIASFAAARVYPEAFQRDFAFGDIKNFQFYASIHIPLLIFIHKALGLNFGVSFLFLLPFTIFLQLTSFYLLGRMLFKNRSWALVYSLLNSVTLWSPRLADYWGIYYQPQPRFLFQALLPGLIIPAIVWRNKPAKWPIIITIAGLIIYVHPVSAPAWAFSIWLGMIFYLPREWGIAKKILWMSGLGLIFVGIASVFLYNYSSSNTVPWIEAYDEVFSKMLRTLSEYYLVPEKVPFAFIVENQNHLLLISGFIGGIITGIRAWKDKDYSLPYIWLVGILFVSIIIPITETQIARSLHVLPYEKDLIRGVRFVYPILIYFTVQGILEIDKRLIKVGESMNNSVNHNSISMYNFVFLVITVVVGLKLYSQNLMDIPRSTLDCWQKNEFSCPSINGSETINTLEIIKNDVPQESLILPVGIPFDCLMIRYYSLHSVAFCAKDRGITIHANPTLFLKWFEISNQLSTILEEEDELLKYKKTIDLARELGAEYLLVGFEIPKNLDNEKVMYFNPKLGVFLVQILY